MIFIRSSISVISSTSFNEWKQGTDQNGASLRCLPDIYSYAESPSFRVSASSSIGKVVQHGRGYVGLSQWMGRGLAFQIEQHNHQVRKALRERLLAMKPGEFEELISQLLAEMGFEMVEVTKLSGDGGIDVRGTWVVGDVVRIKMAVQVKKWKLKNNIQAPVVQQVRGSLGAHEQGLIITTSDFSSGAMKEAAQPDKTPHCRDEW
ncbi:restriction endonuclease [Desulfopila aestuarii]|uniref:Restriction endonuclease n=1 Tax=Desulfopila aestuarii DSM 18488 TaxID=1121416 RepID=A0A1M7YLM8_9BACT|nr:restriction endonuclease [Desulfopila aestuarii]SHO53497.1 Restriction endonuclease [Desulfopila aestuarii DSM 18488]